MDCAESWTLRDSRLKNRLNARRPKCGASHKHIVYISPWCFKYNKYVLPLNIEHFPPSHLCLPFVSSSLPFWFCPWICVCLCLHMVSAIWLRLCFAPLNPDGFKCSKRDRHNVAVSCLSQWWTLCGQSSSVCGLINRVYVWVCMCGYLSVPEQCHSPCVLRFGHCVYGRMSVFVFRYSTKIYKSDMFCLSCDVMMIRSHRIIHG